jgi:hypothetical protein
MQTPATQFIVLAGNQVKKVIYQKFQAFPPDFHHLPTDLSTEIASKGLMSDSG